MIKALSCKQNLHKKLVNILYKNIVLSRKDKYGVKEYHE
jgi:DNA-dependent protein kinase catalytic subunit